MCNVETWLDKSVLDSELTASLQLLSCKVRSGGVLLYIRDDLSYVTSTDLKHGIFFGL